MCVRRVFAVFIAACVIAIAIGTTVRAQNPPARGMRWSTQDTIIFSAVRASST